MTHTTVYKQTFFSTETIEMEPIDSERHICLLPFKHIETMSVFPDSFSGGINMVCYGVMHYFISHGEIKSTSSKILNQPQT